LKLFKLFIGAFFKLFIEAFTSKAFQNFFFKSFSSKALESSLDFSKHLICEKFVQQLQTSFETKNTKTFKNFKQRRRINPSHKTFRKNDSTKSLFSENATQKPTNSQQLSYLQLVNFMLQFVDLVVATLNRLLQLHNFFV
jgi:hypothetical protein